jgi:phosphoribosylaminoimidazole-succinocarboxamide synthase
VRQWLIANKKDDQYPRALTPEVTREASRRYLDIYERIVGAPLPTANDENADVRARLLGNLAAADLM